MWFPTINHLNFAPAVLAGAKFEWLMVEPIIKVHFFALVPYTTH